MGWPLIVGLGEMMNYPGVIAGDPKMLGRDRRDPGRRQDRGRALRRAPTSTDFPAYAAGGPADDHEGTREADAIARVAPGDAGDAAARLRLVRREGADHRRHREGARPAQLHPLHRRLPLRHAGATTGTWTAWCATRSTAGSTRWSRCRWRRSTPRRISGMERELGSIAPGRRADCILTSDLATLPIETVIARGEVVAEAGRCLAPLPDFDWPEAARHTVKMGRDARGGGLRHRGAGGREPGAGAGDRRGREPGADPGARGGARGRGRAGRDGRRARTSARSRWSSGTAAPAAWSTASSRASATTCPARSPRPSRTTATT